MNTQTQTKNYPLTAAARDGFRAVLDVHDDNDRISVHVTGRGGHPSGWNRFTLTGAETATDGDVDELKARVRATLAENRDDEDRDVALDEAAQSWSHEVAERSRHEGRYVVPTVAHVDEGLWAGLTADTSDEELNELADDYMEHDDNIHGFILGELTVYARARRDALRADRMADEEEDGDELQTKCVGCGGDLEPHTAPHTGTFSMACWGCRLFHM